MNYGRKKASQKQKKITSKSTMQGKRVGVRLFKAFLLCLVVIAVAGAAGVGVFALRIIKNAPEVTPDDVKPKGYATTVYADDGSTQIEELVTSGSNRVYKTIDEIPKDLQHAFVAIEDERFYDHNGIDLQGIARAAVVGLTSGDFSEGASTLTQQLIKNNVFPEFVHENTFYDRLERKLQEQYLALKIEKQMNKNEILEAYLNTINLGQSTLGVQSASERYFGKDCSELTLSECAVIAGITQNPTRYDPVTNPEENSKRREKVLGNMLDQGYIEQAAYDEAMADDVYSRIQSVNTTQAADTSYSYFVDALIEQIMENLETQLGYTESQAYNAVYSGGLSIYSTQNLAIQQICDEEMNNDSNYPGLKEYGLDYALTVTRADGTVENYGSGHIKQYVQNTHGNSQGLLYSSEEAARAMVEEWKATIAQEGDTYDEVINITPQPQASATIIDQATGQIKAMVGGRGAKNTSLSLNRAYTGSKRQPGSTFKIVTAYAPAIDTGAASLATLINDEPYTLKGGQVLRNANGRYTGNRTMREAIEWSINVCAVKMSDQVTQQVGLDYAKKLGISTLIESKEINGQIFSDLTQTLALGGLTEGVYNYELCSAFATIANGGVYNEPMLYTKVLDHEGNVLLDGSGETHTAIKESTAACLTSAMQGVVTSGTGTACQLGNMPVAGKTGTTTDDIDLWFCGYTPYYTCAVWGGYDENKPCSYDTNFRFRLWRSIMSRVHSNLQPKDFNMPSTAQRQSVCSVTGLLPGPGCPTTTELIGVDVTTTKCDGKHGGLSSGTGTGTGDGAVTDDGTGNTTTTPDANTGNGGGQTGGGNTGGGNTGDGGNTGGGNTGDGGNTGGGDTGGGNTGGGETGGGNTGGGDTGGGDTGGGGTDPGGGTTPPAQ